MHYLVKAACAAAGIVDLFIALKADRYRQITDTNHLFAHFLVNQRAVCERMERTVVVLLTQTDQVFFAHERFSACIHIEVNTKLLSLCNDAVQILIGKVQLVPILSSPAAGTVHVTGAGRIHQNQPRYLALQLFSLLTDRLCAKICCFKSKIQRRHLQNVRIDFIQKTVHILHPFAVLVLKHCARRVIAFLLKHIASYLLYRIYQLQKCLLAIFRIFIYIAKNAVNCGTYQCAFYLVSCSHVIFLLFLVVMLPVSYTYGVAAMSMPKIKRNPPPAKQICLLHFEPYQ